MKRFSAVYIANGSARHMTFEAEDLNDAQQQAAKWGAGVEGETGDTAPATTALPEAYDLPTTRRLLGNVSERTIYRWLVTGELQRIPESRRVLVTRRSLERFAARN
jgi:hypothetical protein